MSYNWINAKDYTMNSFLLLDRWALRWIFTDCNAYDWFPPEDRDYKLDMAKALYRYPYVAWYVRNKAPECAPDPELVSRGFEWFRHEST